MDWRRYCDVDNQVSCSTKGYFLFNARFPLESRQDDTSVNMNPLLVTVTGVYKSSHLLVFCNISSAGLFCIMRAVQRASLCLTTHWSGCCCCVAVIWHLVKTANGRREQVADSEPANHRKRCGTLKFLEFEINLIDLYVLYLNCT